MATIDRSPQSAGARLAEQPHLGYPAIHIAFDWLQSLGAVWILSGLYWDGWAHISDLVDTFLTPWHAVLYSGFALTGLLLFAVQIRNMRHGLPWNRALPRGYLLSLVGVGLFGVGGAVDFAWHDIFGFEENLEALLSPSHLLLATGGVLLVSGPLRAAWVRSRGKEERGWTGLQPAYLSVFCLLAIFTFFTQFANAFANPDILAAPGPRLETFAWDVTAISSVIIPAGLLMGFILLALRRWPLPTGFLTFMVAGNAIIMFLLHSNMSRTHWPVLLAGLAGGLLAEFLRAGLRPSFERLNSLRLFAFGVPFGLFLFYFLALILTQGIWWSVHMWLGAPFLAGITGWGLSYLSAPPAIPSR